MFDHDPLHVMMFCADDFDHTLHRPKLKDPIDPKSYDCEPNGFLDGELLSPELLKLKVEFAKQHNIPLYIITARPHNDLHRDHIIKCIDSINGFNEDGIGGYKRDRIICLGVEVFDREKQQFHVKSLLKSKLAALEHIHRTEYPYIPKRHILFSDDEPHNATPIAETGYSTLLAKALDPEFQHLRLAYDFITSLHSLPRVTTLGNYAVLVKQKTPDFEPTEHITPALGETGFYWRKMTRPDYTKLAENAMGNPERKSAIASQLASLNDRRQILFTTDVELLKKHILNNSYGTMTSLEDLASKHSIILLGSEGKRKYTPLQNTLPHLTQDPEKTAIIGFPAESGIDLQPVGHDQTLEGARNRLTQLLCLRETLEIILNLINPKTRTISCLTIESGIGLLPVEQINADSTMQIATSPLYSEESSLFHFYDQTHILLYTNNEQYHDVTRPAFIPYTLTSTHKEELMSWFNQDKPTEQYYLKQSEWSQEMLARMETNPACMFPVRKEGENVLTVSDLIGERLRILLRPAVFSGKQPTLLTGTQAAIGIGLFAATASRGQSNESEPSNECCSISGYPPVANVSITL